MAKGIKDKVVIIGMGCSKFGERWDKEADNLMVEAYTEAIADAGIDTKQIDAAWLATAIEEQHVGKSATPLAVALRLPFIPVTRVENYCASGTEAFRGAVYAVASGAADVALALGVEKLKDTGYGGLPQRGRGPLNDMTNPNASAPGSFAQLAAAYRAKHKIEAKDLKGARFALWKNAEKLTDRQQHKLAWIQRFNAPLYRAYLLAQQLRQIYRVPAEQATRLLDAWLKWARRCRLQPFVELAKTIREQRPGIQAAIENKLSNARTEQINTQIRLITRRGFGYHSQQAVIALAMLSLSDLCPPLPTQ